MLPCGRQDDLKFMRLRTKKHELIVTPGSSPGTEVLQSSTSDRLPYLKMLTIFW